VAVVLVLGLLAAVLPAAGGGAVSAARSTYIVELTAPPLATYAGGISAFEATSPRATGHPLQMTGSAVRHYQAFLDTRQSHVLATAGVGRAPVVYRYRTAFPGFAARLTPGEADRLRSTPGVRALTPDGISYPLATKRAPSSSGGSGSGREGPAFLGLPGGLWKGLGGPEHAGEGVIVGVLDTGIYPDHPSFADRPDAAGAGESRYQGPAYQAPPASKWHGECQAGAEFPATSCNNKLIGARYFVSGYGPENLNEHEFLSPRDAVGHGSHTAATAAGNYGVVPTLGGHTVGVASISGIAPRAWIAMYKVCWAGKIVDPKKDEPPQACSDSDNVAAIDAAVHDGVDVINYSLGSSSAQVFGPVERAFLFAVGAGVFVANAAGNTGPEAGTVGSPGAVPWLASVGATTLGRTFQSPVTVTPTGASGGTPVEAKGASLTDALSARPLLDAAALPASGSSPAQAELCLPGSLDAAAVAGKAVLCKRGQNARVDKGKVVRDAGGVGMILYNAKADEEVVADLHWIPAAHVTLETGQAIKALLASGAGAEVKIGASQPVAKPADVMAPFSSRGPQSPVPDIAKPDMTAPGVDILAATSPTPTGAGRPGETFEIMSGTSMASPQVAGAAALLTQLHPTWSPSAVKSALMTSAVPGVTKQDGKTPADPFDAGSGRIDPNRAADPGLVLDAGMADYTRYLKGRDPSVVAGDIAPLAPVDLNLPAITFSSLTGVGSTTRTFTSVDTSSGSWRVTVDGLSGITTTVTPASFDVAAGQAQAVTFAFARNGAPFAAYTFGTVVLTDAGGRTVRLPVSIRPVEVAAPTTLDVATKDGSGTAPITVGAGYSGDLNALGWGLAPPRTLAGQTVGKAAAYRASAPPVEAGPGVDVFDVQVPPSAQVLAAQITNVDGGAPDTDLDLYLFYDKEGDGFDAKDLKTLSAGPGAAESIALALPPPGAYRFVVTGFKTKDPVSTFDFTTWLTADSSPNDPSTPSTVPGLAVGGNPQRVTPGGSATFRLEWLGASADATYFGLVTFHDSTPPDPLRPVAATLVRIIKSPPKAP
jgi:subtilisin family serine protease